jgi:hypothetical protein
MVTTSAGALSFDEAFSFEPVLLCLSELEPFPLAQPDKAIEATSIKLATSEIVRFFMVTLLDFLNVRYHFAAANDHGLMIDY